MRVTGLVARNSLEYVRAAFRLYEERRPFVPIASAESAAALPGIAFDAVEEPAVVTGWFDGRHTPQLGPDTAQVSFTSGTTGTPKGIILPHDALADTTSRLIEAMALDDTVREYVGVPPVYSFGLGRFRAGAAVGGRAYLPPRGFDPAEIARMLGDGGINALSAVPTLLRILIDQADLFAAAATRMRWIEIGSQPMACADKERIRAIFPHARIVQHYGLTEASRTTFLDIHAGAALDSVGRPVGTGEIAICEDGRIRIRGRHVARSWIGAGGVAQLVDADGWLTTNDLGEIRDGYLYFQGRADDLINFGGIKLVPDEIEGRLRARIGAGCRVAVARIPDPLRGDGILVATDDAAALPAELRSAALGVLRDLGIAAGGGLRVAVVAALPTTATGKVQRRALAELVGPEPDPPEADAPLSPDRAAPPPEAVLAVFRRAFPRQAVGSEDSFAALGGDSLAHVSILAALEDRIGAVPEGWEARTVADLGSLIATSETAAHRPFSLRATSTELVLRAGAIVLIVFHHALHVDLSGGIEVLLLLVGANLARFQTGRLASPARWRIAGDVAVRLVLPYLLIVTLYKARNPALVSWPDFLLVSNFFGRNGLLSTPYWFVMGYLQALLILAALAAVPAVGRSMVRQPGRFGAMLLAASLAVKPIGLLVFHHQALRGRTPDQFLYIVALGWCLHEARTAGARAALAGIALLVAAVDNSGATWLWSGFGGSGHGLALAAAMLVLLYAPSIRLPNLIRAGAVAIARASLVIYLSHPVMLVALSRFFPEPRRDHATSYVLIAIILALGIGLYRLLDRALRRTAMSPGLAAWFGRSR